MFPRRRWRKGRRYYHLRVGLGPGDKGRSLVILDPDDEANKKGGNLLKESP